MHPVNLLGPLGPSSSQHRRTPELVLQKRHASFRITFSPPGAEFVVHTPNDSPEPAEEERDAPSHGLATEQFPVSAYVGSLKNLWDLEGLAVPKDAWTRILPSTGPDGWSRSPT